MSKINFKPGNMLYPLPAVMVSCGDINKESNIITVAWTGTICTNPPRLYISVRTERHSYKMIKDILNEPYFLSAKINISGLNSLNIKITEESPVFYTKDDSSYYIFNDKGVLIEIANNIEGRNLVEITGVATEELQLGNKIINNEHIIETLEIIYPYIAENKESIKFDRFDLSKLYDIKGYIGNLEILFGEINDFHKKINDVYNIILNGNVGITSGYIDVSIKNMPVIKKSEE